MAQNQDMQAAAVPQYLSSDAFTVDAESMCGQDMAGELQVPCVLPCEFGVTLASNFEPGAPITVQVPVGNIQVQLPPEAEPGKTLRFRLAPKPDFRVQVPPGWKPGSKVTFQRMDKVDVSVAVPEGHGPGDSFDVAPPALMVQVPTYVGRGGSVVFQGPRAPGLPAEWFRAQVPDGLKPGNVMTARLPMPQPPRQDWSNSWMSCTEPAVEAEAAYAPLQLVQVQSPVQFLSSDPFAVDAELASSASAGGALRAQATLPTELTATLSDNFEPGKLLTIPGPIGPVQITPPVDAKPGMVLRYRLEPTPDMRVQVPQEGRPGSLVVIKRPDGKEISLTVPEGSRPGDFFEAAPPALMVQVPEGARAGDFVIFYGPTIPNQPTLSFQAQVPSGLEPGKFFTAKLPVPILPTKDVSVNSNWGLDSAWKVISGGGA